MECPGLHRDTRALSWQDRALGLWSSHSESSCDDGVLHIPATSVLSALPYQAVTVDEHSVLDRYSSGLNVSWFSPCTGVHREAISQFTCSQRQQCEEASATSANHPQCFRGVHDHIVSIKEIEIALGIGHNLVLKGGDHFDVHHDMQPLEQEGSSILRKLKSLLSERYRLDGIKPVAFRVQIAGPMDDHDVNLYRQPASALNHTVSKFENVGLLTESQSSPSAAFNNPEGVFELD